MTLKRDPIVLGASCILSGDDVGKTRPNANALIVGTSGCGKSTSVILPTVCRMHYSNPIMSYAKERDAYAMASYLKAKGYMVHVLNIVHPQQSTISFDPLLSLESIEDIDALASSIVDSAIRQSADDYWQAKAKPLLASLITAAILNGDDACSVGMVDVLKLFDRLIPKESGYGVETELDEMFQRLAEADPDGYAVREYRSWHALPYRTASCVRDTVAAALSIVFPEAIRKMMQEKPQLDVERFVWHQEALIVITSAVDTAQQEYANLFYRDTERQLLRYAAGCPGGQLPREIRYIFDDFACSAPIQGFVNDISLFRSAGISAIMLLQSEQQLETIYKEGAAIIRQNCAVYAYFPGGFDDRSCEIVSRRMGLLYEDVLYAPMGKVFIMQSGHKPLHIDRYDTLHAQEYQDYLRVIKDQFHQKGGDVNEKICA